MKDYRREWPSQPSEHHTVEQLGSWGHGAGRGPEAQEEQQARGASLAGSN